MLKGGSQLGALVSIIIPTYNRPFNKLKRAIDSVLNQTYKNIEIIIVNDNSVNNSYRLEIKKKIEKIKDQRIKHIMHNKNLGACKARNTGIYYSKGEFIAFLDDDDRWLPKKTELQLKKFIDKEVGLVYSQYYVEKENKKRLLHKRKFKKGYLFNDLLLHNFIGSTSCIMVRKSCLKKTGSFDENLLASQDYELYLRIAQNYKIDFVEEPLIIYYDHKGDRISRNIKAKNNARKYILKKYSKQLDKFPKAKSKKLLRLSLDYFKFKKRRKAIKYWLKGIRAYPLPTLYLFKVTLRLLANK